MSFLLDTNVISEVRKGPRADSSVMSWIEANRGAPVFMSVLVLGELRRGVDLLKRRDAVAAASLEKWVAWITEEYEDRIIGIDQEIAEEWGRMGVPDPVPVVDGLQAATAKVRGLTFVTRNTVDVERTGVKCLNPFS